MSAAAGIAVRELGSADAAALLALRREALASHPWAFSAAPDDDRIRSIESAREVLETDERSAVLGAFDAQDRLVGMVGVVRRPGVKRRHAASIWGLYVTSRARRRSAGAALVRAAVERARSWPGVVRVDLSVAESAAAARRIYTAAGFRSWGIEPRALHWQGRFEDEVHMALDLE